MLTNDPINLVSQAEHSNCTTEIRFEELEQRIAPLVVIAIIAILIGLLVA